MRLVFSLGRFPSCWFDQSARPHRHLFVCGFILAVENNHFTKHGSQIHAMARTCSGKPTVAGLSLERCFAQGALPQVFAKLPRDSLYGDFSLRAVILAAGSSRACAPIDTYLCAAPSLQFKKQTLQLDD